MALNTVLPPNFYNFLRIICSFIHTDIADWQPNFSTTNLSSQMRMKFFRLSIDEKSDFLPYKFQAINISSSFFVNCEYLLISFLVLALLRLSVNVSEKRLMIQKL